MIEEKVRPERLVAWAASVASIALAVAPGLFAWSTGSKPRYDPTLAVLTATVIALVWYTCFTYESVEHQRITDRAAKYQIQVAFNSLAAGILDQLNKLPTRGGETGGAKALKLSQYGPKVAL